MCRKRSTWHRMYIYAVHVDFDPRQFHNVRIYVCMHVHMCIFPCPRRLDPIRGRYRTFFFPFVILLLLFFSFHYLSSFLVPTSPISLRALGPRHSALGTLPLRPIAFVLLFPLSFFLCRTRAPAVAASPSSRQFSVPIMKRIPYDVVRG